MGIAGLGRLGQFHAENMAGRAPSIDLVRVVDPVEDVARSTGQRLGVPWSTGYDASRGTTGRAAAASMVGSWAGLRSWPEPAGMARKVAKPKTASMAVSARVENLVRMGKCAP